MGVQTSTDLTNLPFILQGSGAFKVGTVLTDGGRSGAMVKNTLMSYNPTSKKWVPFTDETATNGQQYPRGILRATLSEAEIQAGDVLNVPILVRGVIVDKNQLVIENSKTLDTIINVPAGFNTAVEDYLRMVGIFMKDSEAIGNFEN
jgi:hypothetical protein